MRAPYLVTITQLDDKTFVVQVGCKSLSFTAFPATELSRYFENPDAVIVEYSKRFGWNLNEPAAPMAAVGVGYAGSAPPRF